MERDGKKSFSLPPTTHRQQQKRGSRREEDVSVRKLPKTRAKSDNHSFPHNTVLTGKKEKNNVEISLRRKTVLYNSLCPDKSKTASFSASLLISAKERVKNFFFRFLCGNSSFFSPPQKTKKKKRGKEEEIILTLIGRGRRRESS